MAEYIDRKALGIGKCNPAVFEDKGYANGWNSAIEIIEEAPTVDVKPVKHGRWSRKLIYNKFDSCIGSMMICSECNKDNKCDKRMDYCPNCGAKNGRKGNTGMTTEKALEMIKFALECFPTAFLALNGTWGKCVEALEKQIPKKVNKFLKAPDGYLSNGDCPSCKERVNEGTMYCEACGQALDWSDDNA